MALNLGWRAIGVAALVRAMRHISSYVPWAWNLEDIALLWRLTVTLAWIVVAWGVLHVLQHRRRIFADFRLYRHDLGIYMRRWIWTTPWWTMRLHHILRSDNDRDLHDHPWSFVSWIVGGPGYTEVTPCIQNRDSTHCCALGVNDCRRAHHVQRFYPRWSIVRRRCTDFHRLVLSAPVWTLVMTTKKVRSWGFDTAGGWTPWRQYETVGSPTASTQLQEAAIAHFIDTVDRSNGTVRSDDEKVVVVNSYIDINRESKL